MLLLPQEEAWYGHLERETDLHINAFPDKTLLK